MDTSAFIFIPYKASSGTWYEFELKPTDWSLIAYIGSFEESMDGTITALPRGDSWNSIAEMTQALKVELLSVNSDPGN
jgi:hypothetical protein